LTTHLAVESLGQLCVVNIREAVARERLLVQNDVVADGEDFALVLAEELAKCGLHIGVELVLTEGVCNGRRRRRRRRCTELRLQRRDLSLHLEQPQLLLRPLMLAPSIELRQLLL
jgi:hypothetical protein